MTAMFFLLLLLALALYLAGSKRVAAWWYRLFHDPDPYDPAFADVDPIEAAYASVGDTFGFSSRGVPVVPGPGPVAEGFEAELYEAIRRYRRGEDIEADAPREAW